MMIHISIVSKSIAYGVIEIQSCSMSDPTFSDINFKKWDGLDLDYPERNSA